MDLIGWEGQEFSQFPQELYSTEFIQGDLLIKAWGCGQHRGRSQWGVPLPRGQSNSSLCRRGQDVCSTRFCEDEVRSYLGKAGFC